MDSTEPWYVLGVGALGTLLAASLLRAGLDCRPLTHRATSERRVFIDNGQRTELTLQPLAWQDGNSIARLLICCKAWALEDATRAALPCLRDDALVIACANGMGFDTTPRALLGERPLLRAVSTEAALRQDRIHVRRTGAGTTRVGNPADAACPGWFHDSLGRVPGVAWEADIDAALWRKFAINCVINPLTATRHCLNGDLLAAPYRSALETLCEETEQVLRASGRWHDEAPLLAAVEAVCHATAANQSSMRRDHDAGRRTEVEYLNGHLVTLAAAHGIDVPMHRDLVAALRARRPAAEAGGT
jgi:2-dehydropantoate 2-reductase